MAQDKREARFLAYHDMVFGPKPTRDRIPFSIMRDYLDWQWETRRNRAGINDGLGALTIREIKDAGRRAFLKARLEGRESG